MWESELLYIIFVWNFQKINAFEAVEHLWYLVLTLKGEGGYENMGRNNL